MWVPWSVSHARGIHAWEGSRAFLHRPLAAVSEGLPGRKAQALLALHKCQEKASSSLGWCSKEAQGLLAEGMCTEAGGAEWTWVEHRYCAGQTWFKVGDAGMS